MSGVRHPWLARQLERHLRGDVPGALEPLLAAIDETYRSAELLGTADLRERCERLLALFDGAPFVLGVAEVTDDDLLVVSGNVTAAAVLGVALHEPIPLAATTLPADVHELWRERADAALETTGPVHFEHALVTPQGARTFRATFTRLALAQGAPCIGFVVDDVTDHQRLFDQVVTRDRRASLGTLAAGMAHEINNPLTYVLGNLVVAIEELVALPEELGALPEGLEASLATIVEGLRDAAAGAGRVQSIVRDLSVFASGAPEAVGAVDLVTVIRFAAKMANGALKKRARFVLDISSSPVVTGDEAKLGQVFVNLLLNACDAIPQGEPRHHEIRVSVGVGDDGLPQVDVADTGRGIAPDVVDRIFDPFFTTKGAEERIGDGRTGLGLAVCAGIVGALGGEITLLCTELGVGSTFRVRLRPAALTEEPIATTTPPPSRRGRVLVIDDEVHVGAAIRRTLARDHDVVCAVGVRAAVTLMRGDRNFDVILCDLRMPAGGGVAVFRALEAMAPELTRRVIIVTGDPSAPQLDEIREALSFPIVVKPFDPKALRHLVREAIARLG